MPAASSTAATSNSDASTTADATFSLPLVDAPPLVPGTSGAATDTVQYVATDPTGLTATSTRTILIEAATPPPAPTATSTSDATTSLPILEAPPLVPDYPATTTIQTTASSTAR